MHDLSVDGTSAAAVLALAPDQYALLPAAVRDAATTAPAWVQHVGRPPTSPPAPPPTTGPPGVDPAEIEDARARIADGDVIGGAEALLALLDRASPDQAITARYYAANALADLPLGNFLKEAAALRLADLVKDAPTHPLAPHAVHDAILLCLADSELEPIRSLAPLEVGGVLPDDLDLLRVLRVEALRDAGDSEAALALLTSRRVAGPASGRAALLEGDLRVDAGQLESAVVAYRRVITERYPAPDWEDRPRRGELRASWLPGDRDIEERALMGVVSTLVALGEVDEAAATLKEADVREWADSYRLVAAWTALNVGDETRAREVLRSISDDRVGPAVLRAALAGERGIAEATRLEAVLTEAHTRALAALQAGDLDGADEVLDDIDSGRLNFRERYALAQRNGIFLRNAVLSTQMLGQWDLSDGTLWAWAHDRLVQDQARRQRAFVFREVRRVEIEAEVADLLAWSAVAGAIAKGETPPMPPIPVRQPVWEAAR